MGLVCGFVVWVELVGVTVLGGGSGFGGFVLRLYVGELVAGLPVCVLLFGVRVALWDVVCWVFCLVFNSIVYVCWYFR